MQTTPKHKLLTLKQVTNQKFVNMHLATYELPNKQLLHYEFVSRKPEKDLAIHTKNHNNPDAVKILPYYKKDGQIFIVLIKEFRHAINDYIYALPAGLVDKGETPKQAAQRELLEEIGATVLNLQPLAKTAYASPGLTDESLACFVAEIKLDQKNKPEIEEDIAQIAHLTMEQAQQQIDTQPADLGTVFMVKNFILLQKLNLLS